MSQMETKNIENGYYEDVANSYYPKSSYNELDSREKKALLQNGDIVMTKFIIDGKTPFYIHDPANGDMIAESDMIILRGKNAAYVSTYLTTDSGKRQFSQQLKTHGTHVAGLQYVYPPNFKKIQIPTIPISDLELASANKLNQLAQNEPIELQEKYELLKIEYQKHRKNDLKAPHEEQLERMEQTLLQVLDGQEKISKNIEDIKSSLSDLVTEFDTIKSLPRDLDEKINRLHDSIDNKLSRLLKDEVKIGSYIKEIKRWFDYFDFLESKSQTYLPQAEFIYDQISQLESPDYSPFILQYCRALENELLQKIFRAYVQSLIDREINLEAEFAWDFKLKESGRPNNANTFKLIMHLKKCLNKAPDLWFFELGSMEVNLRYLTGKSIEKSPLLQDLRDYVLTKFETEIISIEYLDEMKTIIRDYRNQSAHLNLIGTKEATVFHGKIKQCLINLMENYKLNTVHNKT
jgi:uncharacterized protein with PhoU and TrkA domain